ncbi:MAG TPA: M15 family metallopeptidase [Rectinemataceae bacterium]|nr:M15 family metallopeptidase [Rectinemataceae bacterium]
MKPILLVLVCSLVFLSAAGCESAGTVKMKEMKAIVAASGMDAVAAAAFGKRIEAAPERFFSLVDAIKVEMAADPDLLRRADKQKGLASDFEPKDLVVLDGSGLSLSRQGHRLRKPAFDALLAMDKAAKAEGVTLVVSSAYRSYGYQKDLFARYVAEMGEKEASRVSAVPGASQHQLGTAADFGSITDAFAQTVAGKWVAANAGRFGFSLSFPEGMEAVTGYVWESWHFRFIGTTAVAIQDEYFGGVQRYLMLFLDGLSRARPIK